MKQNEPEWIAILRADVKATGSVTATAARVGVSRGGLSAILNNTASSPYANGKCSTTKIQDRVMNTIGRIVCPFLSEMHGEERRITGIECREVHDRDHAPTNSPRAMAHWRACQECDKRVEVTRPRSAAPATKAVKQQAGLIDKITRPLPEVGRPRVWPINVAKDPPPEPDPEPIRQQAGYTDQVTIPLPEVGGPQVNESH